MEEKDPDVTHPTIARFLAAERARPGPDDASREALWGKVLASMGGAPPDGTEGAPPTPAPPTPPPVPSQAPLPTAGLVLSGGKAIGALFAAFLAGGIAGGALLSSLRPRPSDVAPNMVVAASPQAAMSASASVADDPAESRARSARGATTGAAADPERAPSAEIPSSAADPAPSSAPLPAVGSGSPAAIASAKVPVSGARDADLEAERSMLDEARAALVRGDGPGALATLSRHARTFPSGRMGSEREVLTIQALVVSGRREEATRRATAFRAAHPKSLLWPVIERAVGPLP